jgi:hypothetical protein
LAELAVTVLCVLVFGALFLAALEVKGGAEGDQRSQHDGASRAEELTHAYLHAVAPARSGPRWTIAVIPNA